jgi:hypothetical protein
MDRRILLALLATTLLPPAAATAQPCPLPLPICEEPEPEPTPQPPPDQPPAQPKPPPPPPVSAVEGSATAGVDPAHTGYFADPTLAPPLKRRWRAWSDPGWGPPLYGQGRIYSSSGHDLRALDARTGRQLWNVSTRGQTSAYDDGRVFVQGSSELHAHAADDGRLLWSTNLPNDASFPAVATSGMIYTGTRHNVVAVRAASTIVQWQAPYSSLTAVPAVDDGRVYMAAPCSAVSAFDRAAGAAAWSVTGGCTQMGGWMPVVYRGRVYSPGGSVHDAASGAVVGTFSGGTPMFAGDIGVFSDGDDHLEARDLRDGRRLWRAPSKGIGGAAARRVISGNTVFALAGDKLHGFDLRTGARVTDLQMKRTTPDERPSWIAVAPGLVITAFGAELTAWESVYAPGPQAIEIGPRTGAEFSGARALVGGIVGSGLRATGSVVLEYDEAPFGRFRRDITGRIAGDGWVGFRVRVDRNVRFRVRAGTKRSNVSTFYAYPKVSWKFGRAGTSLMRTTATLRHSRRIRLGGRRAYLYLGRKARRRYVRLGTVQLRPAGRGVTRGAFVHAIPTRVGRRDTVAVCFRGQARAGLGQNTGLIRRCGRRSVRF